MDDYLKDGNIIVKSNDDYHCKCNYYNSTSILAQYVPFHLGTLKHKENTPKEEHESLNQILVKINLSKEEKKNYPTRFLLKQKKK